MLLKNIRPHLFYAVAALGTALPTAVPAQTMKSGDVAVLASYYEIRGSDCLALRAPRVSLTLMPRLGKANIMQTRGQSSDSGRCAYQTVPVAQVIYQADQTGNDTLAWDVKYQNKTLGTRRYSATVVVTPGP